MAGNKSLQDASKAKRDEFYTQLPDINAELKHYRLHFKGKTVYCNCDDPRVSNFFHYFSFNFEKLGLKRLITTCFRSQVRDLFSDSQNECESAIWLEYTGDKDGNRIPAPKEIGVHSLKGDGDFRSPECVELLKQSDIVVTNPPFSLFREYVAQLIKYEKKFLIIGNMNAVTYKEIFPLFKENRIWYGPSISSGDREFGVPDHYPLTAASHRIDEEGRKYVKVKGVRWFTNLLHKKRHQDLILVEDYDPEKYPHYDNYNAIEISKTKNIPEDYEGVMGVPITFLDKYNPDQFEILGATESEGKGFSYGLWDPKSRVAQATIRGQRVYKRLFIRNKRLK